MNKASTKPLGWLVGLAVLLITLGVIGGLIGIFLVAKRKQQFRIEEENSAPAKDASPAVTPAAGNVAWTNDMVWIPGGKLLDGLRGRPTGRETGTSSDGGRLLDGQD